MNYLLSTACKSAAPAQQKEPATPSFSVPPNLAHLDALMVEQIMRESMHKYKSIGKIIYKKEKY